MLVVKSPKQRFFDQSYTGRTDQLSLFIQASQEEIICSYFDSSKNQFIGLDVWNLESKSNWHQIGEAIQSILGSEEFRKGFKSCSFALIDRRYTLVPTSLFENDKIQSYLELNHDLGLEDGLGYYSYEVSSLNTKIVYAFPDVLKKILESNINGIKILHYTAPLLESFALNNSKGEELFLHIQQEQFDILYSKDGQLQFFNSFSYTNSEDLLYFLLYVIEQLKIDRNHIELKVSGSIDENTAMFDSLLKYIRHPQLVNRSAAVSYSQPLQLLAAHQYYNLFNQYLCE